MRVLLSHYRVAVALEPDVAKWPKMQEEERQMVLEKGYNMTFLHLANNGKLMTLILQFNFGKPSETDHNKTRSIRSETRTSEDTVVSFRQIFTSGIMDVLSWDGTLSLSDFSRAACKFAEKWKRFNPSFPSWSWVACKKQPWVGSHEVEGYFSLENICLLRLREDDNGEETCIGGEETSCSNEEDEPIDTATLVQSCDSEEHFYDFHVIYSASYRVPVLYFRAYSRGGQPLVLDEIEKDLPSCSANALSKSKWTFITQEEHPYLNRPWYKLHPCGTSESMKLLFLGDTTETKNRVDIEQYLVSWFSVVGQVVGLKIPFEMLNDSNQL